MEELRKRFEENFVFVVKTKCKVCGAEISKYNISKHSKRKYCLQAKRYREDLEFLFSLHENPIVLRLITEKQKMLQFVIARKKCLSL